MKSAPMPIHRRDLESKHNMGEKSNVKISQMPPHMLANTEQQTQTAFFDIHDCYSDMEQEQSSNIYTVPTVHTQQEKRLSRRNRAVCEPLIGGINQDYLEMARLYKLQRPYSDINYSKACVLCRKRKATHVLFPCEHRCVCENCIRKEEICSDSKLSLKAHGCCNCPLCAAIIKKILPFENGKEIERYWSWVYEFPPPLPENFLEVNGQSIHFFLF